MATYSTPEDEAFFSAVGRLAVGWARIEAGLDFTISILHHDLGGHMIEREIPWSLSRKLKYIRKCFNKMPGFETAQEIMFKLLDDIGEASEIRQDIIHSFSFDHEEGATESNRIRFLRGGERWAAKKFKISTAEILAAAYSTHDLSNRAIDFPVKWAELLKAEADQRNKAAGEVAG